MAHATRPGGSLVDLEPVEARIDAALSQVSGELRAAASQLFEAGGKGIRPRLVLLCAQATQSYRTDSSELNWDAVHDVAAAAEMIHVASLIHDDVLDRAEFRRGVASVNAKWGNHTAVLSGDYLFASAFALLAPHAPLGVVQLMTGAIADMCRGELLQKAQCFDPSVCEEEYTRRVHAKTASLLGACCECGARLSGAGEEVSRTMHQFGVKLGLAFQIVDDILDLDGEEEELGKPVGRDLMQGHITLPVIRLLEKPRWRQRIGPRLAQRNIDAETVALVREGARATGAIDQAKATGHMLALEALHHLNLIEASEACRALQSLCHAVVERMR